MILVELVEKVQGRGEDLPIVVEVLSRKDLVNHTGRMNIGEKVLSNIPSAIAQIYTADESQVVINDDELLMVGPVECHVAKILEDVVVGVAHDVDISMAFGAFRTKSTQSMLGMGRVAGQGLLDFLVDNDIDLNTTLGGTFDGLIESPFLIEKGRSSQEELRGQPPIFNVDSFFGVLEGNGDGPHVVTAIDIPLNVVVVTFGEEGLEAMAFADGGPLAVSLLLMFLIVTMIGVDNVLELAEFVFEVDSLDFGIVQLGVCL